MTIHLKCSAENCLYNRSEYCSAEKIMVQGVGARDSEATYCGTFSSKGLGNYVSALGNMNYSGASMQMFGGSHLLEPKVFCNAVNCTYNANQQCQADAVQILNEVSISPEQTECQTFKPA